MFCSSFIAVFLLLLSYACSCLINFSRKAGSSIRMQPWVWLLICWRKFAKNVELVMVCFIELLFRMFSFANCIGGHGSTSPAGFMWWLMPVAAGQSASPL